MKREKTQQRRVWEAEADRILIAATVADGQCRGIKTCPYCPIYGCSTRAYLNPEMRGAR